MIKINRRDFLKGSAAIGVAGALSGTLLNALKPSKAHADEVTATWRPTTCLGCTTWCALEAKVQNDTGILRVVDVRGNRFSQSNSGYVCPRGRMNIQQMYDADRVKTPMKRVGSVRGKGAQFIPISWDDAITEIAEKMIEIRYTPDPDVIKHEGYAEAASTSTTLVDTGEFTSADKYKGYLVELIAGTGSGQIRMITGNTIDTLTVSPAWATTPDVTSEYEIMPSQAHKMAVFRGRYSAVNDVTDAILYSSVPVIMGSPNKVSHSSLCAESEKGGWVNINGAWSYQDYDFANCKYMILWGVDPTSSNRMVPYAIKQFGEAMNNGMKVVVVDPRLSPSAAKAHRWLPVKPGTDGALALAIAYHILNYSTLTLSGKTGSSTIALPSAFINETDTARTSGLARWWALGLSGRTPDWAAGVTGIPALTIKQVACEFAGYNYDVSGNPTTASRTGDDQCKAASWVGPGIAMQPAGVYGAQAAAALNGLIGSFDHIGGVIDKAGSTSTGSLIAAAAYTDAVSAYKGAKTADGTTRSYVRYVNSGPELPLGLPAIGGGSNARGGVAPTNVIGDALKDGYPYSPGNPTKNCKMIISCFANFAFSATGADRWETALANDIYQVNCITHVSESAMFGDIILPSDLHMFENYLFSAGQRANYAKIVGMMKPVCWDGANPDKGKLWDTKWGETEVVWELAQRIATIGVGTVVAGWPADYYFTNLKSYVDAYGAATDSWDFNRLVQLKWGANNSATTWAKLVSDNPADYTGTLGFGIIQGKVDTTLGGTYFDANGRGKAWLGGTTTFGTKSGKIEFSANPAAGGRDSKFEDALSAHAAAHATSIKAVMAACNYDETAASMTTTDADAANDIAFMPHWESPNLDGNEVTYPFTFIDYKSRLNSEGRTANCEWYHEFKSCDAGDEKWKDVIKINPADAASIPGGPVKDGDTVKVTSPSNPTTGVTCKVKLWAGVRSGTAAKCYGQGHWAMGRYASKVFGSLENGGNNNKLMKAETERLVGGNARNANTRVKIVKV